MARPQSRFPNQGGPSNITPYHQQFPSHPSQAHGAGHQSHSLATPGSYMTNAQMNAFSGGNGLALGGGMGSGAGFGVGDQTGLNSHAARLGFHAAHVAQQHPHQQSHGLGGERTSRAGGGAKGRIRDVWKHNFNEELTVLMGLIDDYPYIAMDTEFPGIVARPMGAFRGKSDYHYQCLRTNVDLLKMIQLGVTLFNERGETPADKFNAEAMDAGHGRRAHAGLLPHTWQFNFRFSLKDDMYSQNSIDSLRLAGIDFNALERDGIDHFRFAADFIPSGLVFADNVRWISFHGGYDFGYLTKLLTNTTLPSDETDFDKKMKKLFPRTYDVKHLMKYAIKAHNSGMLTPTDPSSTEILQKFEQKSGLDSIAEALKVKRVGTAHQAGSDALTTGKVFFQLREKLFNGEIAADQIGKIWGLGFSGLEMPVSNQVSNNIEDTPNSATNGNMNGGPSTPNTGSANLVTTPAQSHGANGMGGGMGPVTPGLVGGALSSFYPAR